MIRILVNGEEGGSAWLRNAINDQIGRSPAASPGCLIGVGSQSDELSPEVPGAMSGRNRPD